MRRSFAHYGALLVLGLCLWGHLSELFDHWDNTFQTGNDVEYSTVIAALATGTVLVCSCVAAAMLATLSALPEPLQSPACPPVASPSASCDSSDPSPPLRI